MNQICNAYDEPEAHCIIFGNCSDCPNYMLKEHDKHIGENTIDECIDVLKDSVPLVDNADIIFGFRCSIERLEQLKEEF